MKVLTATMMVATFLASCAGTPVQEKEINAALAGLPHTSLSADDFAYAEMVNAGVSPEFAKDLQTQFFKDKENAENREKIVSLNVLGFLTPGDYTKFFTPKGVKRIREFMKRYKTSLAQAEKNFQVPKEVISALLWVETKHGKTMGQFRLPMVYYSLLQATHPAVAKNTLLELNERKPASNSSAASLTPAALKQKVVQRLITKSKWALEQLKVLEQLSKNRIASRSILSYQSSFAGAFGCSQFIPSSYLKYAVSVKKAAPADLFELNDCVYSVGNFLRQKGWDQANPKSQSEALFEYNRIRDYGDVILKLAAAVKNPAD